MKYIIRMLVVAVAVMLLQRAQAAPYTNYLNEASNLLAVAYGQTAAVPKAHILIGKALADLQKPSTSVAGDFNLFLAAATHLMPLEKIRGFEALSGSFGMVLSNVFTNFVLEAVAELNQTGARVSALNNFQRQKRPAAAQLLQAQRSLQVAATTTSIQIGMLSIKLAFTHISTAARLATLAEANPGFALNSVPGFALNYADNHSSNGFVNFDDALNYSSDGGLGTYIYTRNGLNTALLVLDETGDDTTTKVTLKFTSATGGTFKTRGGSGKFTLATLP